MTDFRKLVFGAALVSLASPAFGANINAPGPTVAGHSWTGSYIGAQFGNGFAEDHIHDESIGAGTSDYSDHFNMDGAIGGLYGGYNYQMGMWVVGAEGNIDFADINGDNANWPFGTDMTAKIRAQGSLRARVGYAYDSSLLYLTGGLAVGNIKTDYYDTGGRHDSGSKWRTGWTVGAGIEHAFTPHWTARLEYRYTDFGRVTDATTTTDSGWLEHNDITETVYRVGISYKF